MATDGRLIFINAMRGADIEQHVWPLVANGRFQSLIHQTFPLAQAAQAQDLMPSSEYIGKIVLEM